MPPYFSTASFDNFLEDGKASILNGQQFCGFGLSDIATCFSEKQDGELLDQWVKFMLTASFEESHYLVEFKNFQNVLNQVFSDFFIENEDEFWFHFESYVLEEQDEFEIARAGF